MAEISPEKQNIDTLFSTTSYFIDFYQREYKWGEEEVGTLLNDIFLKFNAAYDKDLAPTIEMVEGKYGWYYLNTYITNRANGNVYIVDGQQRLTTISLILVSLLKLGKAMDTVSTDMTDWIEDKIHGNSPKGKIYWMGHQKNGGIENERVSVMDSILSGPEDAEVETVTGRNMLENYKYINKYLAQSLTDPHKFQTFVYYFLRRVVLVNLDVNQQDVAMVFEVINDRGLRLNPYEILKGKLLGRIDKAEVDEYNCIWEDNILELEKVKDKELVDTFFRTYFKAKYARTRPQSREFDGGYHKTIFNKEYNQILKLDEPTNIKSYLKHDFTFFTELFKDITTWQEEKYMEQYPEIYFNSLNDLQSQEMVIMSLIHLNDSEVDEKTKLISKEIDRLFVFLQLSGVYDSNRFQEVLFILMTSLADKPIDQYRAEFDKIAIDEINTGRNTLISEPFQYKYFKEQSYTSLNKRFLRYLLSRTELFLTQNLGIKMQDTMWNYVKGTGVGNGYHVEHILGRNNDENMQSFASEEEFETERNRLGALLLLKGADNQSSSNESYSEKLKTYEHTLNWNQTLIENYYKSNTALSSLIAKFGFDLHSIIHFDKDSIEQRTMLLFEICKEIWK